MDCLRILGGVHARLAPKRKGLGNPSGFSDVAELLSEVSGAGFGDIATRHAARLCDVLKDWLPFIESFFCRYNQYQPGARLNVSSLYNYYSQDNLGLEELQINDLS